MALMTKTSFRNCAFAHRKSGSIHYHKTHFRGVCTRYAELLNLDIVIGRLNGPYGRMERDTGVRPLMSPIYQIAKAALTNDVVRLHEPEGAFDWTHVLDLAESVRLLVTAEKLPHRIYNLSSGELRPLSDVLRNWTCSFHRENLYLWMRTSKSDIDLKLSNRGALDISRLKNDVGYKPAYDLEQGLRSVPSLVARHDSIRKHNKRRTYMIAIRAGQLIDGNGNTPTKNGIVLIEGERIKQVGPAEQVQIPPDAQVIDASAKTVLPGLIDVTCMFITSADPKETLH